VHDGTGPIVCFGPFRLDITAGELCVNGQRIRLQEQPFQLLKMLVGRPGEVVTREEIRHQLWPNGTVVEFNHSINAAIKKLRAVLGDSADEPHYIETIGRRGYRLLLSVDRREEARAFPEFEGLASHAPTGLTGKRVSHYRVLEILGGGGMGVVYKAEDLKLGRHVALKFLPEELGTEPKAVERFEREARAASALDHPNICTVHEFGEHEGQPFLVMPLLKGKTLRDRIAEEGPLPIATLLDIAIQIAEGLDAAHAQGIIHRDIKPANVFVTSQGQVKILDFGLAKLQDSEGPDLGPSRVAEAESEQVPNVTTTRTGAAVGTAAYMSPEQVRGEPLDARTDLFSFAAMLYEMATGTQAFHEQSAAILREAILNYTPTAVRNLNRTLPVGLERIIHKALEKDREMRYHGAAEMGADLKHVKREIEFPSSVVSMASAPAHVRRSWARFGARLGVLLGLALAVAAGVWLIRFHGSPAEPLLAVPLTSEVGVAGQPSFSPDGNQVVYYQSSDAGNSYSLYVKAIGVPTPAKRLTIKQGFDFSPAWSPDGRYIAFLRYIPGHERKATVLRIPLTGSPEKALADISIWDVPSVWPVSDLAWFPDGRALVTVDRISPGGPWGLFLVSIDTHEKQRLTTPPPGSGNDATPAVSPDGRWLVFSRGVWQVMHLYIVELTSDHKPRGEPRQITFEDGQQNGPVWTPDGREIVFISGVFANAGLWRVAVSGGRPGEPERLAFADNEVRDVAISRSAHRLVFSRDIGGGYQVWKVDASVRRGRSSPPVKLISSIQTDEDPAYSPDGKRIAFKSTRSGNAMEIWICNSDGSNATQLTFSAAGVHNSLPHWSADGRSILFSSNLGGHDGLYLINSQGGTPKRLMSNASKGSFSRDGNWIYFVSDRTGQSQIWKMPAHASHSYEEAVQVTRNGADFGIESPDGKYLYCVTRGDVTPLTKVALEGGQEVVVLPSILFSNFAVADEGIYFIPGPTQSRFSLQFLSFSSGKISRIADLGSQSIGYVLTASPGLEGTSRSILYEAERRENMNLMLVENFR
jgi:serine/threonine protein kinase/Tol biopolymer transport system component